MASPVSWYGLAWVREVCGLHWTTRGFELCCGVWYVFGERLVTSVSRGLRGMLVSTHSCVGWKTGTFLRTSELGNMAGHLYSTYCIVPLLLTNTRQTLAPEGNQKSEIRRRDARSWNQLRSPIVPTRMRKRDGQRTSSLLRFGVLSSWLLGMNNLRQQYSSARNSLVG